MTQDAKHVILFCEMFAAYRRYLFEEAGTNDWDALTSTKKGLKAITRWVMKTGLLGQFSLAANQLYDFRRAQADNDDEGA